MRAGDLVVVADGQDARTGSGLQAAVFRHEPGERPHLRVSRKGNTAPLEVGAALTEGPARRGHRASVSHT